MNKRIPVIIPSYEPDNRIIELLKDIADNHYIIIVDDGSGVKVTGFWAIMVLYCTMRSIKVRDVL